MEEFIEKQWNDSVIPALQSYIEIPNQSPTFDPEWNTNGYQDQVVQLFKKWLDSFGPTEGVHFEIVKEDHLTPLIFVEIESTIPNETPEQSKENTILLYGHFDKQPPLNPWEEGLSPYTPVIRDGKLYGRGGADDGYAFFAAITSILALKKQGIPHARCVLVIEGCEESGSPHLIYYINKLSDRIGTPSLIICLDSGAGNYEQIWLTNSLRGLIAGNLRVDILKEGVHSGQASGIVPSSFRIIRSLLSRFEDQDTGIIIDNFHVDIPQERREEILRAGEQLGSEVLAQFPWVGEATRTESPGELLLNRTWKPALSVTGVEGIPKLQDAGNVLRTHTTLTLSLRTPPTLPVKEAAAFLKELVEKDPPYGSTVTLDIFKASTGWNSPQLQGWLKEKINEISTEVYGKPCAFTGEGGGIPFMGMLGERFPKAQFVVTGVLGPNSNAHGPNEFLHIDYSARLTICVSKIIQAHAAH